MYKWMYDRYVEECKKEPIEKLVVEILALQNIECSDRAFANQCQAGLTLYNLNELFDKVEGLCNAKPEDDINVLISDIKECFAEAKSSYSFIRHEISEINNDSRCSEEEQRLLENIKKAKKSKG